MTDHKIVNGRRPSGLLHIINPAFMAATRPNPDAMPFDLGAALEAIQPIKCQVRDDAYTASMLGTEREGNAILIDADGLFLTIGYLIAEASVVEVGIGGGNTAEARVVAYDYDTGFGLVQADRRPGITPLTFGASRDVARGDTVIVAAHGGINLAIEATIMAKRRFAGYWEYMVEDALFTVPAHPNWNGAALIDAGGHLVGVGSLYLEDASEDEMSGPGNMFVPIDLLPPIFDDLMMLGRAGGPPRPWIGVYLSELENQIIVSGIAPDGPADIAGLKEEDIITAIDGAPITGLGELYTVIWDAGPAGVEINLEISRDGSRQRISIATADRYANFQLPRDH